METLDFKPYVLFKPTRDKRVLISWTYHVFNKVEEDGVLSCYIPSFDIYFSAANKEAIETKSYAITRLYVDHFFAHHKNGLRAFALQLHKLGFKAKNDAITLKRMIDNQAVNAKFNGGTESLPKAYSESEKVEMESEMEVAI